MKPVKLFFASILIVILAGCAGGPKAVPGKSAVYGVVKTESHKDLVAKAAKNIDVEYSMGGEIVYNKHMVNYNKIDEIYVCLIDPNFSGGNEHSLVASNSGFSLRSLALAPGDKLRIKNKTPRTQNFFIADLGDGFQMFPPIEPGKEGSITVNLKGEIELGSEEDDRLIVSILSRSGLISRRISSGQSYAFERLEPNAYGIIFWFWRLGYIEKRFVAEPGKNLRMNQALSVDRIILSKNEP